MHTLVVQLVTGKKLHEETFPRQIQLCSSTPDGTTAGVFVKEVKASSRDDSQNEKCFRLSLARCGLLTLEKSKTVLYHSKLQRLEKLLVIYQMVASFHKITQDADAINNKDTSTPCTINSLS